MFARDAGTVLVFRRQHRESVAPPTAFGSHRPPRGLHRDCLSLKFRTRQRLVQSGARRPRARFAKENRFQFTLAFSLSQITVSSTPGRFFFI